MQKKHFIATHTFISDETKKEFFEMAKGMSSTDFFTPSKNEHVKCVQHWMGTGDFFFCHWIAESEDAILDFLLKVERISFFIQCARKWITTSHQTMEITIFTPISHMLINLNRRLIINLWH